MADSALHGLDAFDAEFRRAHEMKVNGAPIWVLPLERIIVSKAISALTHLFQTGGEALALPEQAELQAFVFPWRIVRFDEISLIDGS